uniref:HDC06310 n=1 Tax=Drosophila melanogaster TaxID=7227 RepID=Q6IGG9_DROME|nr:TPA_inf: HDC06310 [Drosophila melanogaster]
MQMKMFAFPFPGQAGRSSFHVIDTQIECKPGDLDILWEQDEDADVDEDVEVDMDMDVDVDAKVHKGSPEWRLTGVIQGARHKDITHSKEAFEVHLQYATTSNFDGNEQCVTNTQFGPLCKTHSGRNRSCAG